MSELIDRIRHICVKSGVAPEVMGEICHSVRECNAEAAPGLEKFLGLSRAELEQEDIAFLRENDRLASLRTNHPAGIVRALCAMVLDAEAVIAQHDLCHNLHGKVNAEAFAEGCAAEQRKLYGCAPHADRIDALEHGLRESLKLQSHYADLLNMHDGGQRTQFATVDEWLQRLDDMATS